MAMADQSQHNSVVGGWTDQDVADDSVKALASRSVAKINAESNDRFQLFPVQIISAQSQVVAGMKYKLRIVVGKSNCPKSALTADFANCAEGDQSARKITYEAEGINNSRKESE
uniref:Cystatin domain-containing protein n=1 Tax=Globodera pallida TaxID=36090 RepID=A0A183BL17_GLOPA